MSTSLQSLGGDGCNLTQYTIVKGGTTCVFGTCQQSTNWASLTTDFLLMNLLASQRYSQVICLNFDRQDLEVCSSKLALTWNKNKTTAGGNQVSNLIGSNVAKKLHILNNLHFGGEEHELCTTILDSVRRVLTEASDQTNSASSTGTIATKNVALVVYSASELVLNVGFRAAKAIFASITSLLQEYINTASTVATATTAVTPCIILVVHESLHSAAVLAQIQSLGSVLVRVVPNSGTLASTVAAEVQTIRRSAATGKINESIEMFTCRESLLSPLKPVSDFSSDDAEDADTDMKSITALPTAEQSLDKGEGVGKNTNKSGASNSSSDSVSANNKAIHNQRLITFDSTDPEFDEDSDPDADLDL